MTPEQAAKLWDILGEAIGALARLSDAVEDLSHRVDALEVRGEDREEVTAGGRLIDFPM